MSDSSASHALVSLDASSFGGAVRHGVVLVAFLEPWCGPCHLQLPILERVAERFGRRAMVALVNIDEACQVAVRFHIEAIPTMVLFKKGRTIRTLVGVHSEQELTEVLEGVLEP
ncbi:MAG: thioredoxin family protein [Verrucomicrobia bacterium]|nr:thioredoxin family protein [Verrucomicrobiota bacterium]